MTGTWNLVRLIVRRDRIVAPLWILVLGSVPLLYAVSFAGLYPTPQDRQTFYLGTLSTPAELALVGPIFGSDLGALVAWRAGLLLALVPLAAVLTLVRHTRSEEDAGRTELLGSTAIGHRAQLAAAVLFTGSAVVATGALSAISLMLYGCGAVGSIAFGVGIIAVGLVFIGFAGVAAQLASSARGARGCALAMLAAAFVLRAVGDAGSGTASWLSPIGWSAQLRPFADERWWPLLLSGVLAAVLLVSAFRAASTRDLGGGLLAERHGPATATRSLAGPTTLAWRANRGILIAWTLGLGVIGAVLGIAAKGIGGQVASSAAVTDALGRFGGTTLEQSFIATVLSLLGIGVAAASVSALLHLHSEEDAGLAEVVLSTGVSRTRWMCSHLVFAVLGPVWLLAVTGLGVGVAYGASVGDIGEVLPGILGGAAGQLPAVWVVTAIGAVLFGAVPRFATAIWGVLGGFVALGQVGAIVGLPQWVVDLAPFSHLPHLPGGTVSATPLLILTAIAVLGLGFGAVQWRRRDVRV